MSIIWILLIDMNANPSSLTAGSEIRGLVCYSDPKLLLFFFFKVGPNWSFISQMNRTYILY